MVLLEPGLRQFEVRGLEGDKAHPGNADVLVGSRGSKSRRGRRRSQGDSVNGAPPSLNPSRDLMDGSEEFGFQRQFVCVERVDFDVNLVDGLEIGDV